MPYRRETTVGACQEGLLTLVDSSLIFKWRSWVPPYYYYYYHN
jgi:hypothetical protein